MNQEASQMTDEEMEAAAKRSMAYSILPAVIRAHAWGGAADINLDSEQVVQKAYAIASEMLKQGD